MKYNAKKPKARKETEITEEKLFDAANGFQMRNFTIEVNGSVAAFQVSERLKKVDNRDKSEVLPLHKI